MAFRIYTKGNYFIINDDVNDIEYEGLRKEVIVRKQSELSEDFFFSNVNSWKDPQGGINIADILDELGNNYSLASFVTFYTENTGNFNGGGATPLITSVENGLYLDGTIAKLGGDLTEPTEITGSQSLLLGTGASPLSELSVQVSSGCGLRRQDGTESIFIGFVPNLLNIEYSDLNNITSISYEPNGNGIRIQDDIDNVGLRGATQFTPTDNRDYIQKLYVDSIATGGLIPQGTWNSATNTPTLTSSTNPGGQYLYMVSIGSTGVTNLDGVNTFNAGDIVFWADATNQWYVVQASSGLQDLQGTTDVGNTTTNDIIITDGASYEMFINGTTAEITGLSNSKSFVVSSEKYEHNNNSGQAIFRSESIFMRNNIDDKEVTIFSGNVNSSRQHYLPDGDGTYALSVNGVFADTEGNVTVPIEEANNVIIVDDFLTTGNTTLNIGQLKWGFTTGSGGTIGLGNQTLGHPGTIAILSPTVITQYAILHLSNSATAGTTAYGDIKDMTMIFTIPVHSLGNYYVGLHQNWSNPLVNNCIYLRKLVTDTNLMLVNRNGGIETVTDSGITAASWTWYKFKIVNNTTEIQYWINDVLISTVATNVPSPFTLMIPGTAHNDRRQLFIDYFKLTLNPIR